MSMNDASTRTGARVLGGELMQAFSAQSQAQQDIEAAVSAEETC